MTMTGPVVPGEGARAALRPLDGGMRISGGFWGALQQLNRSVTIPHGIGMLEDSGSLRNLRIAAGQCTGEYALPLFRDSDVYKVAEAIAWERWRGPEPAFERFLAETVALLRAAQRDDGYLNSHTEVVLQGRRFGDPAMGHELYCAGHLLQAAVADLRSGGSPAGQDGAGQPALAQVAGRYADLIETQLDGELAGFVPGHPEIEMALVEFGRVTGRPGLVKAAAQLIGRRGSGSLRWQSFSPVYFSDDIPFEQADRIRGHAVRALYLLAGAADVYAETGAPGLLRASLAQWDDMIAAKTYLTGGVGSRHKDESFGEAFELPPDRAYCETCAAIGSVMWNWRLLMITGEARFADLIERTLLNAVLPGLGRDGRSFFYVNPLHARAVTGRQPWYRCACCPPNIMRLLASLDHYVATATPDGVQVHQFASGRLRADLPSAGTLAAELETGLPAEGWLRVLVTEAPEGPAGLALRMPSWASDVMIILNGRRCQLDPHGDGYLRLTRNWSAGDELTAEFAMPVRAVRADPRLDAVRGCVAFERGPLVYCVESPDLPGHARLDDLAITPDGAGQAGRAARLAAADIAGHRVTALTLPGVLRPEPDGRSGGAWPYRPARPDGHPEGHPDGQARALELRAIPYYAWANRGPAQMRVWLPDDSRR